MKGLIGEVSKAWEEDGDIHVIIAGRSYKVLDPDLTAKNALQATEFWAFDSKGENRISVD
jgi:hypothetical protein